jgi:membrane protease YdiL (CAAX protease family)
MGGEHRTEAVAFVGLLGMTQYGIQRYGKRVWRKLPKRTTLAVWSSAALFAAAHSVVWPSPVALFVLGLGLGYLTARTRSWAASAVCHILFNTTSFVYLVSRG